MIRSRAGSAMRSVILGGALLALALAPASARADVVSPPPTNCPNGSMGATCHGAEYCQPNTCKTNADCTAPEVCEPRSICVGQVNCYGGIASPDGGPSVFPQPAGGTACSTAADCDGGAACMTESVCVTPGSTGTSTGAGGGSSGDTVIHSGCSCEAAGGDTPLALSAMLAAAGAGALARRRRKSARR